ncbi:MAG: CPBP family intramembrane metalloprotease, partial [Actinomycetota bacterium]|nr:CPBP family intramembrane metalloprotease [Actinomycetota bacterium]
VVSGPVQPVLPVLGPAPRRPAGGGDVATAVWAGVWFSTVAAIVALAFGSDLDTTAYFAVLLPAQAMGELFVLLSLFRVKGSGDWRSDVGWGLRVRDAGWLFLGPALQILIALVMVPILDALDLVPSQGVTEEIQRAVSPLEAIAAFLAVALIAPVSEEVFFRGILLRAQLRRFSERKALLLNAGVFAAVHLLDPGTWPLLPGLAFLGWVLAYLTVRSGTVSRAIFVHAGYNTLAVLLNLSA